MHNSLYISDNYNLNYMNVNNQNTITGKELKDKLSTDQFYTILDETITGIDKLEYKIGNNPDIKKYNIRTNRLVEGFNFISIDTFHRYYNPNYKCAKVVIPDDANILESCDMSKIYTVIDSIVLSEIYEADNLSYDLYKQMIYNNPQSLELVSKDSINEELCNLAITKDGSTLKHVPDKFRTDKLYKIAIENNIKALKYTPDNYKTQELCEKLMLHDYDSFDYIPDKYITDELCYKFISRHGNYGLTRIPYKHKTYEICKLAASLSESYSFIKYIPKKFRTKELCNLFNSMDSHDDSEDKDIKFIEKMKQN